VRVNTVNANEYIWDDAWYSDNRPDIYTTGTAGQIYFDSHGGVQLHIVIIADGSKVVDTNAYTYTYTATDTDLLEIYVWPYTFIYQWFIHFVGARARYDASNDHIAGIVMPAPTREAGDEGFWIAGFGFWIGVALAMAVSMLVAGVALAQEGYDLSWWTADGGGQTFSTGGGYSLGGRSASRMLE